MSRVPRIRFKGFEEDWEQRKVNEIIEDYIEKTTIQNQYTVLTSSQQKGIVYQEEYFSDRQVTTNENIGYYVLPRGYFTYRSRSDTNVFVFNRNDIIDKGIISYYYPVFFNKNSDSDFLLRRLNTGIERQIAMAAEGTGQHVLAHSKFKNMGIFVPYLDEQICIGKYFESLDNLITLHQRKLEKLKTIKKSMLENLFPQNGEKTPKIRFSGFTKDWEQRKFDEVFDCTIPNNTLSRAELNYDSGSVRNVHYGDILIKYGSVVDVQNDEIPFATGKCSDDFKDALLQNGDIIIADTAEDETTGKACEIGNLQGVDVVSGLHTMVCRPRKKMALGYLGYYLNSDAYHHQLLPLMQGIKVLSLSKTNVQKTIVYYPKNKGEQELIAGGFHNLDNLITLHQSKLEKLQKIKKSMLESMFV